MPAMFHLTGNRSSAAMPRRHSSPDTVNTAPVVYDAAGDEPEDRVGDVSGQAARPHGNSRAATRAGPSGLSPAAWISLWRIPGATALTRMPSLATHGRVPIEGLEGRLGGGIVHVLAGAAQGGGDLARLR